MSGLATRVVAFAVVVGVLARTAHALPAGAEEPAEGPVTTPSIPVVVRVLVVLVKGAPEPVHVRCAALQRASAPGPEPLLVADTDEHGNLQVYTPVELAADVPSTVRCNVSGSGHAAQVKMTEGREVRGKEEWCGRLLLSLSAPQKRPDDMVLGWQLEVRAKSVLKDAAVTCSSTEPVLLGPGAGGHVSKILDFGLSQNTERLERSNVIKGGDVTCTVVSANKGVLQVLVKEGEEKAADCPVASLSASLTERAEPFGAAAAAATPTAPPEQPSRHLNVSISVGPPARGWLACWASAAVRRLDAAGSYIDDEAYVPGASYVAYETFVDMMVLVSSSPLHLPTSLEPVGGSVSSLEVTCIFAVSPETGSAVKAEVKAQVGETRESSTLPKLEVTVAEVDY